MCFSFRSGESEMYQFIASNHHPPRPEYHNIFYPSMSGIWDLQMRLLSARTNRSRDYKVSTRESLNRELGLRTGAAAVSTVGMA